MLLNAEEYAIYTEQLVRAVVREEAIHNKKNEYVDHVHVYGMLKREIENLGDEVDALKEDLDLYWKLLKNDTSKDKLNERLGILLEIAINAIHEAKQVAAVSQKAITGLSKKEAHTTDQSMYEPLKK